MLSLFQFQEEAAASIASRVAEYLEAPARVTVNRKPHVAPFFQALSALTGAGKTVILAEAVSQISDLMPVKPVVMWMSKGKVVVAQTFANLSPGGKYHHLLDGMEVNALADYSPSAVADTEKALVYFATVGTFNQKEKESSTLLIYKSEVDTLDTSVWSALSQRLDGDGNRRPLIVVYDEAQNLTDPQTDLLMELEPDGFLLASATMKLPARIGTELGYLETAGYDSEFLVTKVNTPAVVSEGLVKDTVLLQGYNTPMEEAIDQLLADRAEAIGETESLGLDFVPKAIYVCNTNVVADTPNQTDGPKQPFDQRQAPPILIWKYLVEQRGIDPAKVAVYADLKTDKDFPLPEDFVLFKGKDQDFYEFTVGDYEHVIFNLTLQEGWDDPSVYFAYIDKSMDSPVQITQVIGRVLRQPGAQHYPAQRLNAAHFYVRVDKNAVFNAVIDEVKDQLGENGAGVRIVVAQPGSQKPQGYQPRLDMFVPETAQDSSRVTVEIADLLATMTDYRGDVVNTRGTGSRRVLRQRVGSSAQQSEWEEFEHSSEASARWFFHREIQRQFKPALGVVNLAEPKLNALVGTGSNAQVHIVAVADSIVSAFVKGVRLVQRKSNPYGVGSVLARPDDIESYKNAVHEGYAGLNGFERRMAEALDKTGRTWARNPPRSGYGVPLITVGPTDNFYPDFLVWTDLRVICLDTKGGHLVDETARRKLLTVKPAADGPRLDIQFVSEGRYDDTLLKVDADGYSRWYLRDDGRPGSTYFADLEGLVADLLDDSRS